MKQYLPLLLLVLLVFSFFIPSVIRGTYPIPSDTIVGLYHPYRDLYAKEYPNGIPFKNFLLTDPVRQQYPWKALTIDSQKEGDLPLWNPYAFGGYPLLANFQSGVFYPLNILFFLLPFLSGWTVYIWLQPILGSIFLYVYLRNLRLSNLASIFGGFIFAYSGFFVAWLEWGNILHTALWLPLILLSIDKVFGTLDDSEKLKKQNAKFPFKIKNYKVWLGIFVISLSSSLFAGHLQTFFYLFLVTIGYIGMRWWQHGREMKTLILFALCALLFATLTFIQWFPTLQFITESARSIDQADWNQPGWFLPWQHLLQFIAPDFFGNPSTLNYYGVWNYGEFIGYIGIIPIFLSIYALFHTRGRETWFYAIVIILALVFALPTVIAKLPFMFSVPFIGTSQPTRLLFLIDFSLAILAAFGLEAVLKKRIHSLFPHIILIGLFGILWGIILFFPQIIPGLIDNIVVAKRNMQLPSLLLVGLSIISFVLLVTKNDRLRLLLILALFMLTVADISRFAGKFTPFTKSDYLYPNSKSITFLQENIGVHRYMSLDSRIFPPNFSSIYHLQSIEGYDPLYLTRYAELLAASERKQPDISRPLGFHRIITPHEPQTEIINLLGVKYVLSLREISYPHLSKVFQEGETRVYENTSVFPRTFFVENVTINSQENKQRSIDFMFNARNNLKTHAIIEGNLPQTKFSSGSAEIINYAANTVMIRTENSGDGFLVLTDTYYPTWKALLRTRTGETVKPLEIYRTNYTFRGVIVPAGSYIVEFKNSLL